MVGPSLSELNFGQNNHGYLSQIFAQSNNSVKEEKERKRKIESGREVKRERGKSERGREGRKERESKKM